MTCGCAQGTGPAYDFIASLSGGSSSSSSLKPRPQTYNVTADVTDCLTNIGPGYHWDSTARKCVPDKLPQTQQQQQTPCSYYVPEENRFLPGVMGLDGKCGPSGKPQSQQQTTTPCSYYVPEENRFLPGVMGLDGKCGPSGKPQSQQQTTPCSYYVPEENRFLPGVMGLDGKCGPSGKPQSQQQTTPCSYYVPEENRFVSGVMRSGLCAKPEEWSDIPCVYTNVDDTDEYQSLVKEATGLDLPSIDESVCQKHKIYLLQSVVDTIEVAAYFPLANAGLNITVPILIGMGQIDEALVNALSSVPILGYVLRPVFDKYLGDYGFTAFSDSFLDLIDDALASYAIFASIAPAPPVQLTAPIATVYRALVFLGREKWDKAAITLLALFLSSAGAKVFAKQIAGFKDEIMAKITSKAETAGGQAQLATVFSALGTAGLAYFDNMFNTPS